MFVIKWKFTWSKLQRLMMPRTRLFAKSSLFMSAVWNGLADGTTVPRQLDNTLTHFHCSLNAALVSWGGKGKLMKSLSIQNMFGWRQSLWEIRTEDNVGTLLTGQADLLQHNPICILMVFWRCPCLRWASVGSALFRPVGFYPWTNQHV